MPDLHPQDWLLFVEATAHWLRYSDDYPSGARRQRAEELIEAICAEQGLSQPEAIAQIDDEWGGPST